MTEDSVSLCVGEREQVKKKRMSVRKRDSEKENNKMCRKTEKAGECAWGFMR